MRQLRSILCFSILAVLAFGANALAGGDAVAFGNAEVTTNQAAVFAAFLANLPNPDDPALSADTAISVSNVLGAPEGQLADIFDHYGDRQGTVQIYLWNKDGTLMTYETSATSPGDGLDENGELAPCHTYTVRLAEILSQITGLPEDENEFTGYGWIIGNFDAIAGTYNVTIFGLGFTQNFELLPGMAQGQTLGGLHLIAPPVL